MLVLPSLFSQIGKRLSPWRCPACGLAGGSPWGQLCPWCRRALSRWQSGCPCCGEPAAENTLCRRCLRRTPPLSQCNAVWLYDPPIDQLLSRYKYQPDFPLAKALIHAALPTIRRWPRAELLVPIPLHPRRLRQRSFNQAELLCRHLSLALAVDWAPLLQRVVDTPAQAGLSSSARRRNLRRAFVANPDVSGKIITLVDDVMTTGSTIFAAARALRQAGASEVNCWVMARTPTGRHAGIQR